jgi:hypothetical protein
VFFFFASASEEGVTVFSDLPVVVCARLGTTTSMSKTNRVAETIRWQVLIRWSFLVISSSRRYKILGSSVRLAARLRENNVCRAVVQFLARKSRAEGFAILQLSDQNSRLSITLGGGRRHLQGRVTLRSASRSTTVTVLPRRTLSKRSYRPFGCRPIPATF